MKRLFLTTVIVFSITLCYAQNKPAKNYTDMVINGSNLWALNTEGDIIEFDTNTGAVKAALHTDTAITALAVNTNGQLIVADKKQQIKLLDDKNLQFQTVATSAVPVYRVVCNSKNGVYLVTTKGITDLKGEKYYLPDSSFQLNRQLRGWWSKPSAVLADAQGNIWIGGEYGEWGGELFIFNTEKKEFIRPVLNNFSLELNPIKSFFAEGKTVYVSCDRMEISASGGIVKFNNYQCSPVFESHDSYKDTVMMLKEVIYEEPKLTPMKIMVAGEEIGPVAFNQSDKCIYFYCQYGIYKGDPSTDLSVIANWKKISTPKLYWKNGKLNTAGSPWNMLEMAFAPNGKLYLLTKNDGIGVYDGTSFSLLQ